MSSLEVKEIDFSSLGAYQVLIDSYWTVLQYDEEETLVDFLCECDQEEAPCVHVIAAQKYIFKNYSHPLHQRFKKSLWNVLCKSAATRMGFEKEALRVLKGWGYASDSGSEKCLFRIEGTRQDWFEVLLNERVKETEKSSLKFSRVSDEEILLWKEGRPSFELGYELSYWSDFAKYLFLLQEGGAFYEMEFEYSHDGFPSGVRIAFKGFQLFFYIAYSDLEELIPTLLAVDSPLKVMFTSHKSIHRITYDKEEMRLLIEREKRSLDEAQGLEKEKGVVIGEWLYVEKKGFYTNEKDIFYQADTIEKEEISSCLEMHTALIESHLSGLKIHKEPLKLHYHLFFDKNDTLYINAYLKERGDIQGYSHLFGNWLYLDDVGFFKVEEVFSSTLHIQIKKAKMSDFVTENKGWLNSQEGFQTHLSSIRANLNYSLDKNQLYFFSENTFENGSMDSKDFGKWFYIHEKGFYAKESKGIFFVQDGMRVDFSDVPFFIHMHEEELEHIPGFFSDSSPISALNLNIVLLSDGSIKITPTYSLKKGYKLTDLKFFDNFIYDKAEGFSRLPSHLCLPHAYQEEKIVPKNEVEFFLSSELTALLPFVSMLDPRLERPKNLSLELLELKRKSSGEFLLNLVYKDEKGFISCLDLWSAMQTKQRFVFTDIGLIDLSEARFEWLLRLDKEVIDQKNKEFSLSTFQLLRMQLFEEVKDLFHENLQKPLWSEILQFKTDIPLDISWLKSTLRPYQATGIQWLWFLYTQKLSGLLCDDMGLGKTHQAMALVAAISAHKKEEKPLFLVVCPTSVIFHWQEKLKTFLPHMRVFTLYGPNRQIEQFQENYDILLTSYGILRIELKKLSKLFFELALFDEAQIAKNHLSQTYKSLSLLKAKMKLGLTGTPIENRLRELKALFDLIIPGYMPSDEHFRDHFILPIEKMQDQRAQEKLSSFIKPFVLRRKKSDVLLELPEKTEEIALAELLEDQRELYNETLIQSKRVLVEELKEDGGPIPYISIFSLIGKLKQICDHPAVFLKEPSRFREYHSGKWNLFVELLHEALESEQKVVVFSHYLAMLDIMESYLQEEGIVFASIRGSTKNRSAELERFCQDPKCMVFLGSLQAVGLGVELTAASVVIHYDRWWNAARENQATDRVYRMGQKRGVQVFKLVTQGTIEDHIAMLIEKKAGLMEDIIGFDDENVLKQLSREEWLAIFNEPLA